MRCDKWWLVLVHLMALVDWEVGEVGWGKKGEG
jgi:hypothetical protein